MDLTEAVIFARALLISVAITGAIAKVDSYIIF